LETIEREKEKPVNIRHMIEQKKSSMNSSRLTEKIIPVILFSIALISILTTAGILFTLLFETIEFFKEVSFIDFFTGTKFKPLGADPKFGVLPLLNGTLLSSVIAMFVAIPIGLTTAIFLSEYASDKARKTLKPILQLYTDFLHLLLLPPC